MYCSGPAIPPCTLAVQVIGVPVRAGDAVFTPNAFTVSADVPTLIVGLLAECWNCTVLPTGRAHASTMYDPAAVGVHCALLPGE
jgi:hypothetical protein